MPKIQDTCTFRFAGLRGGLSVHALALAVAIADQAARADIEVYAETRWVDGLRFFDCTFDAASGPEAVQKSEAVSRALAYIKFETISRALAYIEARGDVFPWRLKRHIAHPGWVHFEDKIDDGHVEPPGPVAAPARKVDGDAVRRCFLREPC